MNLPQLAFKYLAYRLGLSDRHRADVFSIASRVHRELGLRNGSLPTAPQCIGWLRGLLNRGLSPHSVNHHVRVLNAVLRWGADQGLCPPIRLPKIKAAPSPPAAWTLEEVGRLLEAAGHLPGWIGAVQAADWWQALILVLYWTGARIGSVLATRPLDLDMATGVLWLYGIRWLYRQFRRLQAAAGVPITSGMAFHRLRDTCLSYCWAVDPAIAQRQADHTTAELTRRHYVDPRLILAEARQAVDVLPVPNWRPEPKQKMLFE